MRREELEPKRITKHFRQRTAQRFSRQVDIVLENLDKGKVYKIGPRKRAIFFGKQSVIKNLVVIMSLEGELITMYHCDSPKKLKIMNRGA
jgi:hypothetical protein